MEDTKPTTDETKATEPVTEAVVEAPKEEAPVASTKKIAEPIKHVSRWPNIKPGMTVKVHQKIREMTPKGEEKERVQIFEGMVLAVRGSGPSKTFVVRKESFGVGVEKIFPVDLPTLVNVEPVKQAKVRRAKLYYLKGYTKKLKETPIKA
jgi:large subunit ribosomal protein L19